MTAPLPIDRFRALAEAWGGDLSRWPAEERAAAGLLLATDPAARTALDEAMALDAVFAAAPVPAPGAGLRRTILLGADARVGGGFWRTLLRELGGARIAGPALAASLVFGVAMASVLEPAMERVDDASAPDYAELALLDGGFEDYLP